MSVAFTLKFFNMEKFAKQYPKEKFNRSYKNTFLKPGDYTFKTREIETPDKVDFLNFYYLNSCLQLGRGLEDFFLCKEKKAC